MSVLMCPNTRIYSVTEISPGRISVHAVVQMNAPNQPNGSEGISSIDLEMDADQAAILFQKLRVVLAHRT
jgi:hypothetical protein